MVRKLIFISCCVSSLFLNSCVERKLTITTEPPGALVVLNDEEIGQSPVTVGFEWYGDYNITISKQNYITLHDHKNLPRPLNDKFPLDFFDDAFHTRIDEYAWNFKLQPYVPPTKEELIDRAVQLRQEALIDPNGIGYPKPLPPKKVKSKPAKTNDKKAFGEPNKP